jgi:Flp pilus assembly protein TadG
VIIVPVIIIATLVVVQFVLLWHGRHVAQAAAQTAARAAATYQGSAEGGRVDGDAYLAEVAPNLLPGPDVQVTRDATTVTVTIHADVLTVIPFGNFTVDERARAPVEAFQAAAP